MHARLICFGLVLHTRLVIAIEIDHACFTGIRAMINSIQYQSITKRKAGRTVCIKIKNKDTNMEIPHFHTCYFFLFRRCPWKICKLHHHFKQRPCSFSRWNDVTSWTLICAQCVGVPPSATTIRFSCMCGPVTARFLMYVCHGKQHVFLCARSRSSVPVSILDMIILSLCRG